MNTKWPYPGQKVLNMRKPSALFSFMYGNWRKQSVISFFILISLIFGLTAPVLKKM